MTFNTSLKILASTAGVSLALFLGAMAFHGQYEAKQVQKTYWYFENKQNNEGLALYRELDDADRERFMMKECVSDACKALGIQPSDVADTPKARRWAIAGGADVLLLIMLVAMFRKRRPKAPRAQEQKKDPPATKTQIEMIRRLDHWRETAGLTQPEAKVLISQLLQRAAEAKKRREMHLDPYRFMSPAAAARARERDRKAAERAKVQAEREAVKAEKAAEREKLREQKAEERTYRKREAEQEKLYKLRDSLASGGTVKKAKAGKARAIQEFQQLMIDVLADNRIEPQEVRRIKAWLTANSQYPTEFASGLEIMDEALKDGAISSEEQAAIFEATLDCLITLRTRES